MFISARATILLRNVMAKSPSLASDHRTYDRARQPSVNERFGAKHGLDSMWVSTGSRRKTRQTKTLLPDRYPDFQPAVAGERVELLVIALEIWRVGRLQA